MNATAGGSANVALSTGSFPYNWGLDGSRRRDWGHDHAQGRHSRPLGRWLQGSDGRSAPSAFIRTAKGSRRCLVVTVIRAHEPRASPSRVLGAAGTIAPAIVRDLAVSDEVERIGLLDLDGERAAPLRSGTAAARRRAASSTLEWRTRSCGRWARSTCSSTPPPTGSTCDAMRACLAAGCHVPRPRWALLDDPATSSSWGTNSAGPACSRCSGSVRARQDEPDGRSVRSRCWRRAGSGRDDRDRGRWA